MTHTVFWERIDTLGLEYAQIQLDPLILQGDVVVVEDDVPCSAHYRIEYDDRFVAKNAFINLKRNGTQRECAIHREQLQGLADLDLSITPSTNTAPIRRLALQTGDAVEITAAWIRFPELDLVPLRQIYRRIATNTYDYEAPDLGFRTVLDCDGDGIVTNYHGLWRRR